MKKLCTTALMVSFLLTSFAIAGGTHKKTSWYPQSLSDFLAKRKIVVSVDAGGGYANNVYLVSGNEKGDLFGNVLIEGEWRREFDDVSSLYLVASIERKQYLQETDGSELFMDFFGEYYNVWDVWGLGISDMISYEDYRSFDEEGGVLPAGEYESRANNLRTFSTWQYAKAQNLEAGLSFRIKDYMDSDLDFNEIGFNISHRWDITDKLLSKLSYEFRAQDYADLQALSSDGTFSDSNPTVDLNVTRIRAQLVKKFRRLAKASAFLRHAKSEENFEGEGSYDELGVGSTATIPMGKRYVLEGYFTMYKRDYDIRLVPESLSTQKDDFFILEIMLERQIQGTLSAFCTVDLKTRDSNDPSNDYSDISIGMGIRAVL